MPPLHDNLDRVRATIAGAAARSGRRADEITLVAVTKYVDSRVARQLVEAGCRDLGESRPQQLWQKAADLADIPVRWHLIGHLQRNKAARTLPHVALLHSADSPALIETLEADSSKLSRRQPVLIEVNISGDATKHGFAPQAIEPILASLAALGHLEVRGLMAMAGRDGDVDAARRDFASLRELRDRLRAVSPAGLRWDDLSMGMSGDYEAAIEEGATIVRVGSALFEGLL